jgi:hypothetical protein
MDTSLIYYFLIIVSNRYSTPPMEHFLKSFKMGPSITTHHYNNLLFNYLFYNINLCKRRELNENNILMKNNVGSRGERGFLF